MVNITYDKDQCKVYEIIDGNLKVSLINYGAAVYSVQLAQENGSFLQLALGCQTPDDFMANRAYFGATVGRMANRITKAAFFLNGKEYRLDKNNGENQCHGGAEGFAHKFWDGHIIDEHTVEFTIESPDGASGYPGNVTAKAIYTVKNGSIIMRHKGVSDADTILNMTNHTYWSLGGAGKSVLDEELALNCLCYEESGEGLLPTGQILSVKGTGLDFTVPKKIGKDINDTHPMIKGSRGYDLFYAIDTRQKDGCAGPFDAERKLAPCARLTDPDTKITMTVYTTYPAMTLYTANGPLSRIKGFDGEGYGAHMAVCLETSFMGDAINYPHLGNVILKAGEEYDQYTEYVIEQR